MTYLHKTSYKSRQIFDWFCAGG